MDLVNTLAARLGLEPGHAEAVIGAILGAAKDQVPDAETQKLESAVPELDGWAAAAKQLLAQPEPAPAAAQPEGGLFGGLLGDLVGAAGSGLGNQLLGAVAGKEAQQAATVVALLDRLGIGASKAVLIAPVLLDFLEDRIGADWTQRILSAAPILAGLTPAADSRAPTAAGGAAGGLGSLLGMFKGS